MRTRTEVALRERVPHRLLPLVESVRRTAGHGTGERAAAPGAPSPGGTSAARRSWTVLRAAARRDLEPGAGGERAGDGARGAACVPTLGSPLREKASRHMIEIVNAEAA
ncbi:hypothetical protein GCM10010121_018090 [Streptomyces brasiliensis]|uniref:Uncharacterized protein n=1 Tax=Streptomyces brasiliensis TaxID=1954 RepID=A0A917NKT6_9ACTN|nr:hypothetical protein GCM10010121_018090 [Streptomyces brasiliensis]